MGVKAWQQKLPGVKDVRPCRCPICAVAGVGIDGRINLHGHGTRARGLLGPGELGGEPTATEVVTRRYECQPCGAVVVVGPRGLVVGYLYSAMAIGLALYLWGVLKQRAQDVQRALSTDRIRGGSQPERWRTLRRWAEEAAAGRIWTSVQVSGTGLAREQAERVARILCARAGPAEDDLQRIWSASAHAR